MLAIYKKELSAYFNNFFGYAFIFIFTVLCGFFFIRDCIFSGTNELNDIFAGMSTISMLIVPLLTVQMFTMEKKQNTWTMLVAAPVDAFGIVLGKYLAAVSVILLCVSFTWIYAIVLSIYVPVFLGEFVINQIGYALMLCAFTAIGELISVMSKRRLAASAITLCVLFIMFITSLSSSYIGSAALTSVLKIFSPYTAYSYFSLGIFSLSGMVYLLTICAICLVLAARYVEYGRSRGI